MVVLILTSSYHMRNNFPCLNLIKFKWIMSIRCTYVYSWMQPPSKMLPMIYNLPWDTFNLCPTPRMYYTWQLHFTMLYDLSRLMIHSWLKSKSEVIWIRGCNSWWPFMISSKTTRRLLSANLILSSRAPHTHIASTTHLL